MSVELDEGSQVGVRVFWTTMDGSRYEGILKEWDGNVAIVECDDGLTRSVEC